MKHTGNVVISNPNRLRVRCWNQNHGWLWRLLNPNWFKFVSFNEFFDSRAERITVKFDTGGYYSRIMAVSDGTEWHKIYFYHSNGRLKTTKRPTGRAARSARHGKPRKQIQLVISGRDWKRSDDPIEVTVS